MRGGGVVFFLPPATHLLNQLASVNDDDFCIDLLVFQPTLQSKIRNTRTDATVNKFSNAKPETVGPVVI
jgi:hypothetical protein